MDYKVLLEEAEERELALLDVINGLLDIIQKIKSREKWKQLKKDWADTSK